MARSPTLCAEQSLACTVVGLQDQNLTHLSINPILYRNIGNGWLPLYYAVR